MTSTENIKELFFNSLKRGTGEAYLILKNNPTIDFSALIVKGATKNYAYDPQCEGSRASYIYRLIQKSKQKEKIIKTVLKKWQTKTNDFWSSDQMFDLAVLLYKEGYLKDKNLLYERFEDNYLQYSEFWGEERLIAIDGVEGILKVAEVIGKTIFENPENWVDSYMIDDFQKRNKAIDIYAELERASMKSQNIKAYYNSILENKWKVSRIRKIKRFSYELVKESIEDRRFGILQSSRNIELTDTEVEKLANEFLSEKDNQLKERYLRFFRSRKFPFDYKPIFQIASGKNPKKDTDLLRLDSQPTADRCPKTPETKMVVLEFGEFLQDTPVQLSSFAPIFRKSGARLAKNREQSRPINLVLNGLTFQKTKYAKNTT